MVNIYAETSADEINLDELELYHLIMDYRAQNGLSAIPLSDALTATAGRHTLDTLYNIWDAGLALPPGANLHSWSDAPYYSDHRDPGVMWYAPQRLGLTYPSEGYEISAAGYADVAAALAGWQGSPGHNNVILNQSGWSSLTWNAIGIGVEFDPTVGTYGGLVYHVWFGTVTDPGGVPQILGDEAANTIVGTDFDDSISALGGNDIVDGGTGADVLIGGVGDDTIDGGAGSDTAGYDGDFADFGISYDAATGIFTLTDLDLSDGLDEGTDTITGVETFAFADASKTAAELMAAMGSVLSVDVLNTGSFGNNFNGQTDADGVVAFTFSNAGADLLLSLDGFDVDFADEIEVLLNGASLGFLDKGPNEGLQPDQFVLAAAGQMLGDNLLEFHQARSVTWKWGVTNLELTEIPRLEEDVISGDPFGNQFMGLSDPDGIASFVFTGTGADMRLTFDGFDVDFANEVEVLVNGTSLGFLETGVNEDFEFYEIAIDAADQVPGENLLQIRQARDVGWKWGGENLLLTEEAPSDFRLLRDVQETGSWGNRFDGQMDPDGSVFAGFVGTGDTLQLDFEGFDIDFANEVEVLLNGASLGFLGAGVNEGFQSYQLTLDAADQVIGDNLLEFRQALDTTWKWGVTDLMLTEIA